MKCIIFPTPFQILLGDGINEDFSMEYKSHMGKKLYVRKSLEGMSKGIGYLEEERLGWLLLKRRVIA
jgi:gluconate kinase